MAYLALTFPCLASQYSVRVDNSPDKDVTEMHSELFGYFTRLGTVKINNDN